MNRKLFIFIVVAALLGIAYFVRSRSFARMRGHGGTATSTRAHECDGCIRTWTKCNTRCTVDDKACWDRCDAAKNSCTAPCQ